MYRAPVEEIAFTLKHVAGLSDAMAAGAFPGVSEDLVDAVLAEAGRFASERMAPLNRIGDAQRSRLVDGSVVTPPGWRVTYRDWTAAGWNGISAPEEAGGQALPTVLSAATQEIWNAACMAFALCPMLTMGAVEALHRHGSDDLKAKWLPRVVSGEWTATMNLTEAQAGSDLGGLATRAEPRGDGSYRLFGQKTFITYGEHDLADNIVHFVLARLPDAPPGSRGISLFLVPKFLLSEDGGLGARNDLFCARLEEKLGIHGSPTCTMIYGDGRFGAEPGAVGWLIGEAHRGLACMFTMMNNARLMVGVQGVGQAELATQHAAAYAAERRQGRAPGWDGDGMSPIAAHPDVRRTLLTMRALTTAARAICLSCAFATDMAGQPPDSTANRASIGPDPARNNAQVDWRARADLLTPVAKAFATDIGFEVASLGLQVHGGAGYIEETGAAQILRDSRIAMIYEGTNGIQAIDLLLRKLPLSGGEAIRGLLSDFRGIAERCRAENRPEFGRMGPRLAAALDDLETTTGHLITLLQAGRTAEALAGATPYLRLFGLAAGGAYLAKGAISSRADTGSEPSYHIAIAHFFTENLIPQTAGLRLAVTEGADAILAGNLPAPG